MTRPCHETEAWLGQSRAALSEAQRLSLEQHLGECADCRGLHGMSRVLGELVRAAPTELSAAARERAIAGAFVSANQVREPRRSWLGRSLAGVAVAAAALVFYAWPSATWVEGAGTHAFAHASVTLRDARVRFDESTATLTLARGALEVEVDPRPHAPFVVQTAHFRALVLGTSFHVDAERVVVRHGHVRVLAGDRQLADLHAGERYERKPVVAAIAAAPIEAAPVEAAPVEAAPVEQAAPVERARAKRARARSVAEAPRPVAEAPRPVEASTDYLSQARAALARDALDETRRLLGEAEAAARTPHDRAEAGTLRAELALRERHQSAAIAAYLTVAKRYPELASGENALFAAAQLSTPEAARPLLERYLARYPQGRFSAQVRARLR
ncbi:MAG TPA: FecR domain-containing protein [Polyangiales bacterium]|nr:FecR domain-containing protein [Polyangiales bacterium]